MISRPSSPQGDICVNTSRLKTDLMHAKSVAEALASTITSGAEEWAWANNTQKVGYLQTQLSQFQSKLTTPFTHEFRTKPLKDLNANIENRIIEVELVKLCWD